MKQYFNGLMDTEGVLGIMMLSTAGEVLYKHDPSNLLLAGPVGEIAMEMVNVMPGDLQEADMVFSERRVYLRKTPLGPLLVFLALTAPVAMVRLHCDTLLPTLKPPKRAGGLKRFFGKWR